VSNTLQLVVQVQLRHRYKISSRSPVLGAGIR
jgi:hypothetical protein